MTAIDLAWDSGVTDGDPGEGRIRVNAAGIRSATHLLVNAMDRHEAALGHLLSGIGAGDVLHIERPDGAGLIVAWVLGTVVHGGTYYKVPVTVRSVDGSFAAHDLVRLHRQAEIIVSTGTEVARVESVVEQRVGDGLVSMPPDTEAVLAQLIGDMQARICDLERDVASLKRHAIVDVETDIRRVA